VIHVHQLVALKVESEQEVFGFGAQELNPRRKIFGTFLDDTIVHIDGDGALRGQLVTKDGTSAQVRFDVDPMRWHQVDDVLKASCPCRRGIAWWRDHRQQ
jgi:hypothetical protein